MTTPQQPPCCGLCQAIAGRDGMDPLRWGRVVAEQIAASGGSLVTVAAILSMMSVGEVEAYHREAARAKEDRS